MHTKLKEQRYAFLVLMLSIIYFPLLYGDKYPNFSLKGVDGKHYDQNQFKDKEFVCIVLYSNHCSIEPYFPNQINQAM